MDAVALMNRVDTKYLISKDVAIKALTELTDNYRVLEIAENRLFQYRTIYYDTEDHLMLNEHLRGKLNREKVRAREYVGTDARFLEVKLKTNKGRTIKTRVKKVGDLGQLLPAEGVFLKGASSFEPDQLQPVSEILFNRTTLVSKTGLERVTFDFNLSFSHDQEKKDLPDLVIVEMKRDTQGASESEAASVLKELHAQPSSMSKYCIGMILLNETNKYNRYKPKLLKLNKLSANGNIW